MAVNIHFVEYVELYISCQHIQFLPLILWFQMSNVQLVNVERVIYLIEGNITIHDA